MATPSAQVIVLQAQGYARQVFDVPPSGFGRGQIVRIKARSGVRYQLKVVGQDGASAPPSLKVKRVKKDLQVTLGEGAQSSEFVLEGYFEVVPDDFSALVGQSENGSFYEYLIDGGDSAKSLSSLLESQNSLAAVLGASEVSMASGTALGVLAINPVLATIGAAGLAAVDAASLYGIDSAGGTDSSEQTGPVIDPVQSALKSVADFAQAQRSGLAQAADAAPDLSTYTAAGISGVNASNLNAINDVLASAAIDGAAADTAAELQAIVNTVNKVLNAANGTDGDASATISATDYATLGVTGVSAAVAALLSDVIDGKNATDIDTVAELQTLADAAKQVLAYVDPVLHAATAPTATQINALTGAGSAGSSVSPVTPDNLALVLAALAAANGGGTLVSGQSSLQALVVDALRAYTAALAAISTAAQANIASDINPNATVYAVAGVTDVNSGNLAAINSALNSTAIGSDQTNSAAKVQAIVDAYNAILGEANGASPDANATRNPSAEQYAAVGADIGVAATQPQNLALLNQIVGAQSSAGVSTVNALSELARIANAIQTIAAGGTATPALTEADLSRIGLVGVTPDNLSAVLAAIAAKNDNGSETNALSQLQAAVDNVSQSLDVLRSFAQNNALGLAQPTGTPPDAITYANAGVTGVTAANVDAINDALASAAVDGAKADTPAELQSIVNAVNKVLSAANGTDGDATAAATATDYANLGVTGVSAATAALLGDVVDSKTVNDVDSVAELQAMADAAKLVLGYNSASAAITAGTVPTVADLSHLVTGVTEANLAAMLSALEVANGSATSAAPVNQASLQALVDRITQSLSAITAAADNNTAAATTPSVTSYAAAGVTGVNADNLALVNDMLNTAAIRGSDVDSPAKIQATVDAVQKIRALADGTAGTGAVLDNADITALGLSQVIRLEADRDLFNDILDKASSTSVDSAANILNLASIAARVVQTGLGQAPAVALTAADLQAVGLSGVNDANLSRVLAAIDAAVSNADARPVDTLGEVQTLINTVNWQASTAAVTMAEATQGVSATELLNGLQTVVALPALASVGDKLTLSLKDPNGDLREVVYTLTAQDLAAGTVTLTVPRTSVEEDGSYTLTSHITRVSDDLPTADSVSTFTLDATAPTLFVTRISDDAVSLMTTMTGEFSAAERGVVLTTVATPVAIQGTTNAEVGQGVQVTLNGVTYTATVAAGVSAQPNTWTITLPTADAIALNHGNTYSVRVQANDVAGNPTEEERFNLFVNTAYPDVPTVDNLFAHGTLNGLVYAATPTLTGKAAKLVSIGADPTVSSNYIALAGTDQIVVNVNGQIITGTIASMPAGLSYNSATKTWSLNTSLVSSFIPLADGTYDVSVTVTAGSVTRTDMGSHELKILSTPPVVTLNPLAGDGYINALESNQDLIISGTTDAQVGSAVTFTLGGLTYNAKVQAGMGVGEANTFLLSVPATAVHALSSGAQTTLLSVTNRYGSVTQLSPGLNVDTQAPGKNPDGSDAAVAVPTVVLPESVNATPGINKAELADGSGIQVNVTLPTGSVAGDVVQIAVTAPNGTVRTVTHTLSAADITYAASHSGSVVLSVPATTVAENGSYTLTVTTQDVAGNVSHVSTPLGFSLDTQAPGQNPDGSLAAMPAPVLTLAEAVNGVNQVELADGLQYQIALPSGSKTGDTLNFIFTAPDGTQRTASRTVTADEAAAGSISLILSAALVNEDGIYTVTVTSTDAAGNLGSHVAHTGTTSFLLNAALSTLRDAAQGNTANATTPDASVYAKAGITGVNVNNLAAINNALSSNAVDSTATNTVAKVQAIVDAYSAILAEANGSATDATLSSDPTQAQYAAIGVTGVDTAAKETLLGAVIGTKVPGDVDTVAALQTLANAVAATVSYTGAAGQTGPDATQLNSLTGGTGATHLVTPDNLAAVQAAIAAGNTDGTPIASEVELQGLIDAAITAYNTALSTLSTFAQTNAAGLIQAAPGTAPTPADYAAAGVTGVDVSNVNAINDALASQAVGSAQADTAAEVQAIVNAYKAVFTEANGNLADANAASNPIPAQYALIGANIGAAATDADNLALLNAIVAAKTATGVDTIAKLDELARIANAIQTLAAGGTPAPALTPADLSLLGLSGMTPDNLPAVLNAIAAQPDSGAGTDSLSELQGVIDTAVTAYQSALTAIQSAAQNNNATDTQPALAQYQALGLTGVNAQNLAALNSALNDGDITGTQADTAAKLHTIVDAYNLILGAADGVPSNAVDPAASDYTAIGVSGVNTSQELSLLGEVLDGKVRTDVDTVAKLQALASAVQAVMDGNATQAQLEALGVTGVTPANLSTVQAALALATDATELNTQAHLQTVVTNAINALSAIQAAAQSNTASVTTPSLAQYDDMGVTGVSIANLAAINDALNDADITGSQADTAAKVQAIVDGFNAVLGNANDATQANPTQAHYTAIGVNGVDTAQEVSLLGDVVDAKASTDVDTIARLQALADAVQAVMNGNPTEAQLAALGVTGVSSANLSTVQAALVAANDTTQLNTATGLQTLVSNAIGVLSVIENAAQSNNATSTTPTAAQYAAMGVTGVTDQNLAAINSALNDADVTGAQANTAPKVQAIVDGFNAVLDNADGLSNNASNPSQANYEAIGLNGVDTAQEVTLLGDVLDGKAPADVNTTGKVQALADAVQAVMNGSATLLQLQALGVTGVTSDNLSTVQAALTAAVDATELNTQTGLQTVVNDAVNALAAIQAAAQANTATATTPSVTQYNALGVTGVTAQNLASVNDALNDMDVTGAQANTAAKVQAIVDGFNAILDNATGGTNTNVIHPSLANYAAIGVTGMNMTEEVSLLGDVIDGKGNVDVNTVAKVQALADAVQAVMDGNATEAQLIALGVTGVTSANLSTVQAALAAATDATELNSQAGLQTVVTHAINAALAIEAAAQSNTATATTPSAAQYAAIVVLF